jgi:hypothetical protein
MQKHTINVSIDLGALRAELLHSLQSAIKNEIRGAMKRIIVFIFVLLALGGCATSQEIKRPDGTVEYLIACGASLGWDICYEKANHVCPSGYITLSENAGFNRKELRIACPSAKKATQ